MDRYDNEQGDWPRVSFKFRKGSGVRVYRIDSSGQREEMNEDGSVKTGGGMAGKIATVLMLILAGLMALLFFTGPATPEPVAGLIFLALLGFLAFSRATRDRNPPPRPAHVEQFGRDLNMAAIPFAIVFIVVIVVLMAGGKPW